MYAILKQLIGLFRLVDEKKKGRNIVGTPMRYIKDEGKHVPT
jgi:hypothetical protein